MTTAFLGIGSNVDAEQNIRSAIRALGNTFTNLSLSPIYRSPSVGFEGEDFINLVAGIDTEKTPMELRAYLRDLEDRHGRRRDTPKFSDRSLDVDILLYADIIIDSPELQLPRPEILLFAHVLKPLADLAPDTPYPGRSETIATLWTQSNLDDTCLQEITLEEDA